MSNALQELQSQKTSITKLLELIGEDEYEELRTKANALFNEIDQLSYKALGEPVKKQVGAWQSFEMTPMKKLSEASRKFMSSHQLPSAQEFELIEAARQMVNAFLMDFEKHMNMTWKPFTAKVTELGFNWN